MFQPIRHRVRTSWPRLSDLWQDLQATPARYSGGFGSIPFFEASESKPWQASAEASRLRA
jgi:hypothetical protein